VWGDLTRRWLPKIARDEIVDFITRWSAKCDLPVRFFLSGLSLFPGRFYEWKKRYQKDNRHNGAQPKEHWLLDEEKTAITNYAKQYPLQGYRRLTFMMLDENVAAASPSSVYRVLKAADLLMAQEGKPSKKGTGFVQPTFAHEHWHIDISYINIAGTFFYLCMVLDGYSRYIVHWDLREKMQESDVEIILQAAKEKFPEAKPRIISDNGPQFIATDFKAFIRLMEMSHVKTSPYYPQSNGKLERLNRTIKSECVREANMSSYERGRSVIDNYVHYYLHVRLHSAIGYITPADKLAGKEQKIFAERTFKLKQARQKRLSVINGKQDKMGE